MTLSGCGFCRTHFFFLWYRKANVYNAYVNTDGYTLEAFQDEAGRFVRQLIPHESRATIIALSGDLGAGKTTFTQALARALGVTDEVVSPTFVIQKRYPLEGQVFKNLVHVDAYRLEDVEELRALGWDELTADAENIIVIEWPEHVVGALEGDEHPLRFTYINQDLRDIAYGDEH